MIGDTLPFSCDFIQDLGSPFYWIYGLTLDCFSEMGLSSLGFERFITHGGLLLFIFSFFTIYRLFIHRRLLSLVSSLSFVFLVFLIPTIYFFINRWYFHNFIAFPAINRFLNARLGPERVNIMLTYDPIASLKRNNYYLAEYYYSYFLYHFRPLPDFDKPLIEIEYAFSTRSISEESHRVIPNCIKYPDYCQFNLTLPEAINIANQLGISNPLRVSVEKNHNFFFPKYLGDDDYLPMVIIIKRCEADPGIDLDYRTGNIIAYPTGQPC